MRWVGVCAVLLAAHSMTGPSVAAPVESGRVARVTDGDTFRLESGERIRIAGIDAAESQPGSYKRTVARVRLDGRDLGERLVSEGIARWWPRGHPKPDWCGD